MAPSLLDYVFGFSAEAPPLFPHDPSDERAWRSPGYRDTWGGFEGGASTGNYIRADEAVGVSCMFLGVRIYANLLGTSQVRFYRNRPRDEGEDQIYDHPLLQVLAPDGRANPWMSGAHWRMWTEAQATLWGLGVSEIKFNTGKLELWPIEGEHIVKVELTSAGQKRYSIAVPGEVTRTLMQDQCFQLEGFGTHKLIPESLLRRSREAVAVWLAQEQFRGTYFERGASPSIIFKHPKQMSDPALERFKKQVQGKVGGNRNAHKVVVIEEGMETSEFGHTAKNAQLVEAWEAQATEFSRLLGLPPYMMGVSKQPPYASREQATREFLDFQLRPKARLWEAAIKRDLVVEPGVVCEVDLDELKRGDALQQAQVDAIYIMNGVLDENEVRRGLGRNPVPGLSGPRRSVNQDRGGDPRQPREDNPGDRQAGELVPGLTAEGIIDGRESRRLARETDVDRMGMVLRATGEQLLRREVEQVRRRAIQLAADPQAWAQWVEEFYRGHLEIMSARLAVEPARARVYTERHMSDVLTCGIGVCDSWEKDSAAIEEMVLL